MRLFEMGRAPTPLPATYFVNNVDEALFVKINRLTPALDLDDAANFGTYF